MTTATTPESPISGDNRAGEGLGGAAANGAQNAAQTSGPTTYGAIADWLEGLE